MKVYPRPMLGGKPVSVPQSLAGPKVKATVTFMSSDEFVDFAMDLLDAQERRTGKKIVDPWPD